MPWCCSDSMMVCPLRSELLVRDDRCLVPQAVASQLLLIADIDRCMAEQPGAASPRQSTFVGQQHDVQRPELPGQMLEHVVPASQIASPPPDARGDETDSRRDGLGRPL